MATLDVLNIDCFTDPAKRERWYNEARGLSVDKATGMGNTNGGIVNPQREHLKVGQQYYRLISNPTGDTEEDRSKQIKYRVGGAWWMDAETLNNIYQRYRATGPNERMPMATDPESSSYREWLALPFAWNKIEMIIVATLEARLDCYSGFGRTAKGSSPDDIRAFGYAPHLSNLFTIKQLCIPELYVHLDSAFPRYEVVPFAKIGDVARGQVI